MSARQQQIPTTEFAAAMLERDAGFRERVRRFEARFGPANANTLAVLAQTAYLCWFECEYQRNFVDACRAIGGSRPTSLTLCGQVTPRRWLALNAYVIGIQQWLGIELPVPGPVSGRAQKISEWLGHRSAAKDSLAMLLLHRFVGELLGTSLAKLAGVSAPDDGEYQDFTSWYACHDGTLYSAGEDDKLINELCDRVRRHMSRDPATADVLLEGLLRPSQPACMHRYTRYLDIKIASIGALSWRGNLPPDDEVPKGEAAAWLEKAAARVQAWLDADPAMDELAETVRRSLGKPTEQSRYVVQAFLLAPKTDLTAVFFDWLCARAEEERTTARYRLR
jgi:hypothetical protein